MNTMGIWLPVHLHFYQEAKIDYIWIRNKEITQRRAVLDIVLALDSNSLDDILPDTQNIEFKIKRTHDPVEQTHRVRSKYSHSEIVI
jgi:hypothetical protein